MEYTDKEKLELFKKYYKSRLGLRGEIGEWVVEQCEKVGQYEDIIGRGGVMLDKIIVTEEQAKFINKIKMQNFKHKHDEVWEIARILIREDIEINLVTIARIVEGEPYEVAHEYKVGDIVVRNGMLYEVLEVNVHLVDDRCTLVCKAENREDLAHE